MTAACRQSSPGRAIGQCPSGPPRRSSIRPPPPLVPGGPERSILEEEIKSQCTPDSR